MRRYEEITKADSCLNKARSDEMIFVLLGRDAAAPDTIRFWASERVRLGKNNPTDAQIQEAIKCAETMGMEHDHIVGKNVFDEQWGKP